MTSQPTATPLPLRNDTILGVCEGWAEEFSFNGNWLRIAFCALMFFSPSIAFGGYLAMGVALVAVRRWGPRPAAEPAASVEVADEAPVALPLAA